MRLNRIDLENAATDLLSEDDKYVLSAIYRSRVSTLLWVFPAMFLFILIRFVRFFLSNDLVKNSAGIFCLCVLVIIPGILVFRKCIWPYKLDVKAGFKYRVMQQVIRKQYFPYTRQYFISLSDANYMHHEVDQLTYESVAVGDSYPVYFAAHSRYAFNMRGRITMM